MGWPKGRPRKIKEVMPPGSDVSADDNALPSSQPEVRAQRPRLADSLAAQKAAQRPNWKLKAGNLWDAHDVDDNDVPDVLKIPRDVYPEGVEFMWGTRSIRGQDMPQTRNEYRKQGWFEVNDEDLAQWSAFYDYAKNRWARDESGYIVHEACILLIQREEITRAAIRKMENRAKEQLRIREQAITGGAINASGADHPSALGHNRITKTIERIEVPKD